MPSLIPDVAAFERRLAGLPVVKHPAHEVVLTACVYRKPYPR